MLTRLAVLLISFSIISFEILLMKLFSYSSWSYFVSPIISLALMGFGISGSFLALLKNWLLKNFYQAFCINSILFSISIPIGFYLTQQLPFNPLELMWDKVQFLHMLVFFGILSLVFFFGANCIGLSFIYFKNKIHQIYFYDLIGASLGAVCIILVLFWQPPNSALQLLCLIPLLAAFLVSLTVKRLFIKVVIVVVFLSQIFLSNKLTTPKLSEYKDLARALTIPGTKIIEENFSPMGTITVLNSPTIPYRYAPGLSLKFNGIIPEQLGLYIDGNFVGTISKIDKPLGKFFTSLPNSIAYQLVEKPKVLIIGAGGGDDIHLARYFQASKNDIAEVNNQIINLLQRYFPSFNKIDSKTTNTNFYLKEGRSFVKSSKKKYDLISISLLESMSTSNIGGTNLKSNYLYTKEAFSDYLNHLSPNGIICITGWNKNPPRGSLKLFSTALSALEGQKKPANHLLLMRTLQTFTLIVNKREFTKEQTGTIINYCENRLFDLDYIPNIVEQRKKDFITLQKNYYSLGTRALCSGGETKKTFINNYKFNINPSTDDKPNFYHFLKLDTLIEVFKLQRKGFSVLEWTYPFLFFTLLQALIVGVIFILLPIKLRKRKKFKPALSTYFLLLGTSFFLIEISFIEKFTLYLGNPLYAVAIILSSFLLFAGIGSYCSSKMIILGNKIPFNLPNKEIFLSILGILSITVLYNLYLNNFFQIFVSSSTLLKSIIAIILIAPLGFFLGMPFAQGLTKIAKLKPSFIPWAFGINGVASVVSVILATILIIFLGHKITVFIAIFLYGLAPFTFNPD